MDQAQVLDKLRVLSELSGQPAPEAVWGRDLDARLRKALREGVRNALESQGPAPAGLDKFDYLFDIEVNDDKPSRASVLVDLAMVRLCQGRRGEAEILYREIERIESVEGADDVADDERAAAAVLGEYLYRRDLQGCGRVGVTGS